MARGDANANSDIDLLVDLQPGASGLALGGMLVDVEALLGRRADVLTVGFLPPGLRERVLQEAVPLRHRSLEAWTYSRLRIPSNSSRLA